MEYKDIKCLMEDMGKSRLSEMDIEFPDGTKISLKKQKGEIAKVVKEEQQVEQEVIQTIENEKQGNIVKSPMVGTFYSKPSPSSDNFIKIGSKVKKGDKLCVIEAMKLMNEIESEFDGEVVEIYVKNEEMVDYGKPLFRIV